MNNWHQFLLAEGARFRADDGAAVAHFRHPLAPDTLAAGFVAVIGDMGLIRTSGADAADFLHKQMTADVLHLTPTSVRLAGYCSPKGRLLATLLIWRDADDVMLQVPRSQLGALQKRWQMFIMRAKVTLTDATGAEAVAVLLGIGGARGEAALRAHFDALPSTPYSRVDTAHGQLLRIGDAFGAPRYQWLTSVARARALWPQLTSTLALGGADAWTLSGIHAGVPQLGSETADRFVPQMINFELLGGVDFKKGCYPGQEIVARSQYLGKLKRRAVLARIDVADIADVAAGAELFALDDPGQPCGTVVNAAQNALGGVDALVEIKLAALSAGQVRLASPDGAPLTWLVMPYALDALAL